MTVEQTTVTSEWSEEWPTELGWYWFYGYLSEFEAKPNTWNNEKVAPKRLATVKVRKIANGVVHVADGHFMFPAEGGQGVWLRLQEPELPKESI